jgi:dTDP-4-dehydrorhamnose 3,5-epimerase
MNIKSDFNIEGVLLIEPIIHKDERGWFLESFNDNIQLDDFSIVQENHSYTNKAYTFRGFHHQKEPYSQDKLVRCLRGRILDVVIDMRPNSSTFLKSISIELNDLDKMQLFIPKGCYHGFLTLSDNVEVSYKVNQPYNKKSEISLNPYDSLLTMVDWKNHTIKYISDKDKNGECLDEIIKNGR